jgi:hypothetical protein
MVGEHLAVWIVAHQRGNDGRFAHARIARDEQGLLAAFVEPFLDFSKEPFAPGKVLQFLV